MTWVSLTRSHGQTGRRHRCIPLASVGRAMTGRVFLSMCSERDHDVHEEDSAGNVLGEALPMNLLYAVSAKSNPLY